MMVRRKFTWQAPPSSEYDESQDTRDAATLVCFYAYDIYYASADPFYCVNINLKPKPSAEEQTIMRFDCKMALLWSPIVRRFVFAEPIKKYYTTCRYEDYMWHHAMVSIDESGKGQLFIDGVASSLMEPYDQNDLSKGFDPAPLDNFFETQVYPNKCTSRRRDLLEFEESTSRKLQQIPEETPLQVSVAFSNSKPVGVDGLNDNSDQPISDSFALRTVTDSCCSFYIGSKCDPLDLHEFKTFAGFIDEAAIWNRALEQYEIKSTMFHMPEKTVARELEGPRGVQVDYTAGRVFYARFNNPCMETPEQAPPPPSPPPPSMEGFDQLQTRRRLQQITDTNGVRRPFISDKAGYSAFAVEAGSEIIDIDDDRLFFRNFPQNAKYAYGGVPWAPPFLTSVSTGGQPIPLDGGMKVTIEGIGFAKSPFMKCMNVQPDPAEVFTQIGKPYVNPDTFEVEHPYNNFYHHMPGKGSASGDQWSFDETTQYMKTPASVIFQKGATVDWVNQYDYHHPDNDNLWDPESDDTREGNIPPFVRNVLDSHEYDYVYGSWEVITCEMPAAAFPSQDYYFGVSNDGGYSGSPPSEVVNTYMDYAIVFDGTGSFSLPDELRDEMGSTFTVSAWVYPTKVPANDQEKQVIVEFGTGTGILFEGTIISALNNAKQTPSANETKIDEWHFVMAVYDGTTASFYLDGVDQFSYGGGSSSRSFAGFPEGGPSQVIFGSGFFGAIDEVKIWTKPIAFEELVFPNQIMFTREMMGADSTGVIAYYRMNNMTEYIDPETNLIKDEMMLYHATGSGGFGFAPYAVPWEPSTIYSVDTTEAESLEIITTPQTGSQVLSVSGFNLASSQWTGCYWGQSSMSTKVINFTVEAEPDYPVCSVPELLIDGDSYDFSSVYGQVKYDYYQELLGRVDMRTALMEPYPAKMLDMSSGIFAPATGLSEDGQTFQCATPAVEEPTYAQLGPGNLNTFNIFGMEFTEVALECDGSNYLWADQVVSKLDNADGYTFGLWTLPHSNGPVGPGVPDGPLNPANKRKLLAESSDKNLRRKLLATTGAPQTILAFESTTGDVRNNGLLMYDGERFFYYDDCILDVTQTGAASVPDEWHFVMVSITSEGEGTIMVDGKSVETFTTTCMPSIPDGKFSVCQDWDMPSDGTPTSSSTYTGLVDEIMVFDSALDVDAMKGFMFKEYDTSVHTPVAYFTFSDPTNMLPYGAEASSSEMFVKSTGPWFPGTVVHVLPDDIDASGGTLVSIYGTNFAPSQWLQVGFDDTEVFPLFDIPSGLTAVSVDMRDGEHGCHEGDVQISVNNHDQVPSYALEEGDTVVTYNATTVDLYKDLLVRYTYDLEWGSPHPTNEDGDTMFLVYDYSGNENNMMYPVDHLHQDKDMYTEHGVFFGSGAVGGMIDWSAIVSGYSEYTVCANVLMLINEQTAPWAGAWKLICLVHKGDTVSVYINNAPADDLAAEWYKEHFSDNILGNNESGYTDDLFVYGRALMGCEIEARYYTSDYSIDFTKIIQKEELQLTGDSPEGPTGAPDGPTHLVNPVKMVLTELNNFRTMTAWLYPYETDGIQTIMSSDANILVENTLSRDAVVSFSLVENALHFDFHYGCTCMPCSSHLEYTSWKTKVPARVWTHVGIGLGDLAELGEGPGYFLAFYVDGMMKDLQKFPNIMLPELGNTFYLGQESTYALTSFPFKGLVTDIVVFNDTLLPHDVKTVMQCPPKTTYDQDISLDFTEGAGDTALNGQVTGLSGLWVNTTYDDPTSPASTTTFGEMESKISGTIGRFTITSRTACQKKRISGGDDYKVTMTAPDSSVYTPALVDTNDGNYHVEYKNLMCDTYETSITLDDKELFNFDIVIQPGETDPTKTHIVDGMFTPMCFGTQTKFIIQTVDTFGCLKTDMADTFNVSFTGPYEFDADVTPMGGGKYQVSFVPEAPGDYHMTLIMTSAPGGPAMIKDGQYFCISVCSEGALQLGGGAGVVFEEDGAGITDIDLSFDAVTMELWFKLPSDFEPSSDIYLLHKGGSTQLGEYTKTYEMVVNSVGELSASVYVGLNEIRTVKVDVSELVSNQVWYHIAAVYDTNTFTMYMSGVEIGSASFPTSLPVKTNEYHHPLEIGAGFTGMIDEVKLWKTARSLAEIIDTMYCSPYLEIEHVAAYFPFNEGSGVVASGHGAACPPQGDLAIVGQCLQGQLPDGVTFTSDTPSTTAGEGFNAPSPVYSKDFGAGISVYSASSESQQFTIIARDKCKYAYTKTDNTAFTATTKGYTVTYFDTRPPFGTEYPVMNKRETTPAVYAAPPASKICPGEDATPGPPKGDIYTGYLSTSVAGAYYLEIACNGVLMHEPYYHLVEPNVPTTFSIDDSRVSQGTVAAGVPASIGVFLQDAWDNTVFVETAFTAEITLLSKPDGTGAVAPKTVTLGADDVSFNPLTAEYTLFITLGYAGTYSLILTGDGMTMASLTFQVSSVPWRNLLTDDLSVPLPTRRFEHTSAIFGGDLYIFGGAQYDKTYLNDMYVLKNADMIDGVEAAKEMLAYKKKVTVEYSISTEKDITIEVVVNTAELVAAGRMTSNCLDVAFTMPNNGEPLNFYLDPWPGCNKETTLYWVRLPAGTVSAAASLMQIEMYYGNPYIGITTPNELNNASAVFHMYEGFEDGAPGVGMFSLSTSCDNLAPVNPNAFQVLSQLPFAGKYSLYAVWGQEGVLVADAPSPITDFKLRAWFYDSDATNSSHYISSDFGSCPLSADEGGKYLLPNAGGPLDAISSAIGAYTLSHATKYCMASPWESTADDAELGLNQVMRSADWHLFEIQSYLGKVTLTIDEKKVKEVEGYNTLDKVLISSGFGVDSALHPGLKNSHAFWDEISVAVMEPGVPPGSVSVTAMADDEAVAQLENRQWFKVDTNGTPPPPRYAHSSVVHDGKMYIFGGERSAYAYNDIWAYDFATSTWSFVTPTNKAPDARFDHTAAVTSDGQMIIYGGRSGLEPLADMWAFDISTSTWSLISDGAEAGARFGHSAAIPHGSSDMYVFGGYAEYGFSGAYFRCELLSGKCFNITLGCENPDVSSSFLPAGLVHRYEHTSFADADFVYIYGGASIVDTYGYSGIYRFAVAECSWEEIPVMGMPVARYEHVAGLMEGGFYVHGGHAGGDYYDDTLFFPL